MSAARTLRRCQVCGKRRVCEQYAKAAIMRRKRVVRQFVWACAGCTKGKACITRRALDRLRRRPTAPPALTIGVLDDDEE